MGLTQSFWVTLMRGQSLIGGDLRENGGKDNNWRELVSKTQCCCREEPVNKMLLGGKFKSINKCVCVSRWDKNYTDSKGEMM